MLPPIAPLDAPAQPGWWPPAPGWWIVGVLLFLALMWGLSRFMLWRIRGWRRREPPLSTRELALAALDELARREKASDREIAYRLNEILRAALLDTGKQPVWHPFSPVSDVAVDEEAWRAFWSDLEMRYRPPNDESRACGDAWISVARGWLEQLPGNSNTPELH